MYTLYFSPGACSLAIQVVLRELGQPFELVNKASVAVYQRINPVGAVPALAVEGKVLTEGAAIILYLLEKHANDLLPASTEARQKAIEHLMFANATLHPAYSKLFFLSSELAEGEIKELAMATAANHICKLWQLVETKLQTQPYLGGQQYSVADILLAVYANWGAFFSVAISIGPLSQVMIAKVQALPSYQAALVAEQQAT
ncbi:glutathione S-transferase N-terminal domain-containing protein [Rheinheimera soli]|uniref:Glutathione S-transferase n=1 Tax=Rheinheimera soli TaxID=443616 RepID=A0ABU1VV06_9GAMM|nr:glutathione S-transferase N-terminal domain-containing protein [Rheinheimera soli]MDR7119561.1 glutathione S-transferase [Rheinheimera soli]